MLDSSHLEMPAPYLSEAARDQAFAPPFVANPLG